MTESLSVLVPSSGLRTVICSSLTVTEPCNERRLVSPNPTGKLVSSALYVCRSGRNQKSHKGTKKIDTTGRSQFIVLLPYRPGVFLGFYRRRIKLVRSTNGYTFSISGEGILRRTNYPSGKHSEVFYEEYWPTILSGEVRHKEITNRRENGEIY